MYVKNTCCFLVKSFYETCFASKMQDTLKWAKDTSTKIRKKIKRTDQKSLDTNLTTCFHDYGEQKTTSPLEYVCVQT